MANTRKKTFDMVIAALLIAISIMIPMYFGFLSIRLNLHRHHHRSCAHVHRHDDFRHCCCGRPWPSHGFFWPATDRS